MVQSWMRTAMSETNFPYLTRYLRRDYPETTNAIDDWFKRCLTDKPSSLRAESIKDWGPLMAQWVDRWFLQFSGFIEKGDKDE